MFNVMCCYVRNTIADRALTLAGDNVSISAMRLNKNDLTNPDLIKV
jgi:hypothetical protein